MPPFNGFKFKGLKGAASSGRGGPMRLSATTSAARGAALLQTKVTVSSGRPPASTRSLTTGKALTRGIPALMKFASRFAMSLGSAGRVGPVLRTSFHHVLVTQHPFCGSGSIYWVFRTVRCCVECSFCQPHMLACTNISPFRHCCIVMRPRIFSATPPRPPPPSPRQGGATVPVVGIPFQLCCHSQSAAFCRPSTPTAGQLEDRLVRAPAPAVAHLPAQRRGCPHSGAAYS